MLTRSSAKIMFQRAPLALSLLASFGLLTGCGTGAFAPASGSLAGSTMVGGKVMGGQSPIQGATVRLYATSASATDYGQAATLIGTTTTDTNGNFNIQPTVNCPAGQQTYITSAGGYQSSPSPYTATTTANSSTLEMAALGPCHVLGTAAYQNGFVINEVTSVAAAYALSGFMTTSVGSDGLSVANVSAPVNNNSGTAAITATAPAGLTHAFLNAANLVSPANPSSTTAGGTANSTFVVSVAGANPSVSVPAAEINTLADMMASCINGLSGNANCTSLFSLTPSIAGTPATNTLQAFTNLARNPYPSAAAMGTGTGSLFGLVPASGAAFAPTLTTAPNDYSMAIVYGRTAPTLSAPYYIGLDANDSVYVGNASATTPTPALYAVSPYGIATPTFGAQTSGSATRGLAADALGNMWIANNAGLVTPFSTTTGKAGTAIAISPSGAYGVAVDLQNNVWVGSTATTGVNVQQFVQANAYAVGAQATATTGIYEVTVDATQNVWPAGYIGGGTTAFEVVNSGSVATPTYKAGAAGLLTATYAGGVTYPFSVVMDPSGNAWTAITGSFTTATAGLEEVIPNATLSATSITPQTFIPGTTAGTQSNILGTRSPQIMAIDGASTIFTAENQGIGKIGIHGYLLQAGAGGNQILSPTAGFQGCYLATATTTTCSTGTVVSMQTTVYPAVYNPRQVVIDSTGSVWAGVTSGGVTQIIGLAAPSYPVLSVGKPALSPGHTATSTLP